MFLVRFLPIAVVAGLSSLSPGLNAQSIAAPVRVLDRVDESRLVVLGGNTPPAAVAANDRGRVAADLELSDLVLVLRRSPQQQAAFDSFVASQYDPQSPDYHRWLRPEQVGALYGPAEADLAAVTAWLTGEGLQVGELAKDRLSIRFSGTAGRVEAAFHTEIHHLSVAGKPHIANMRDPQIPAALAPVVAGVNALNDFFPRPMHRKAAPRFIAGFGLGQTPKLDAASEEPGFQMLPGLNDARPEFGVKDSNNNRYELVAPYDLAAMYNLLPLWTPGPGQPVIDGAGQKIAIAGTSNINLNDVAAFRQRTGLPPNQPKVVLPNGDPGMTSSALVEDRLENTLDVEWAGAVARDAEIVLVASKKTSTLTDALYTSASYVVNNKTAPVLSVSYGKCELLLGTAGNMAYNNLWQTAAAEGIAVIVAGGDSGAAGCDAGIDTRDSYYTAARGLAVNGLSTTPYDLAVGGTDLDWTQADWSPKNGTNQANARGYVPEVPWNDTVANPIVVASLNRSRGLTYNAEGWANYWFSNWENGNNDTDIYESYVAAVGGGGGVSGCTTSASSGVAGCSGGYPRPSWQVGVPGLSGSGNRLVPDLSFFAGDGELGSAYLICDTLLPDGNGGAMAASCNYSIAANALNQTVGGTGVAAPVMAGVMALVNQKAGYAQGNPAPFLYALAARQDYSNCSAETVTNASGCYFNDIDAGNNAVPCDAYHASPNCTAATSGDYLGILSGYTAGTGYDLPTGLGSLNVANVVRVWASTQVAVAELSASSLNFPATPAGSSSAPKTVTLRNIGSGALKLSAIGVQSSQFTQTNNCGSALAAGKTCSIAVSFAPTAAGQFTGTLSLVDNAANSPQAVSLTGQGTAPAVSFSPPSFTFPPTRAGTSAATASILVTNTGGAALSFRGRGIVLKGPNAPSFSLTSGCGDSLKPGASCTLSVGFKPKTAGTFSANILMTDNAPNSPQSVPLSGVGK